MLKSVEWKLHRILDGFNELVPICMAMVPLFLCHSPYPAKQICAKSIQLVWSRRYVSTMKYRIVKWHNRISYNNWPGKASWKKIIGFLRCFAVEPMSFYPFLKHVRKKTRWNSRQAEKLLIYFQLSHCGIKTMIFFTLLTLFNIFK